jgi:hypothetical protein
MYCLQDLQLRWPFRAVGRERSVLTCFNISAVTKLQDPAYWCSTARHHTCRTPQYSCRPPWCHIIVPSKSECLWTAADGQTAIKGFFCFIATAAQIALSSNRDLARFSSKRGIMWQCQATLQQDTVPPGSVASKPSVIPDTNFAPMLLTHSEDAQVSSVLTATEMPATAL